MLSCTALTAGLTSGSNSIMWSGEGRGPGGGAEARSVLHFAPARCTTVSGEGGVSKSNCSVASTYQGLGGPGVELPVYPLAVLLAAQPSLQSSAAQQCYL